MASGLPPNQSFASLLWETLRLGWQALWRSNTNPVRPLVLRQQALNVLGLPPNATPQEIKQRYRMLAKKYHPDRGGDARQMQRIIAAYEYLLKH